MLAELPEDLLQQWRRALVFSWMTISDIQRVVRAGTKVIRIDYDIGGSRHPTDPDGPTIVGLDLVSLDADARLQHPTWDELEILIADVGERVGVPEGDLDRAQMCTSQDLHARLRVLVGRLELHALAHALRACGGEIGIHHQDGEHHIHTVGADTDRVLAQMRAAHWPAIHDAVGERSIAVGPHGLHLGGD